MDAVKFIEEATRMCNANISNCAECCKGRACPINLPGANYTPEERTKLVEEWAAAHPRKTRQSVFLEQYPKAAIDVNGVLQICPMAISDTYRDSNEECVNPTKRCEDCRREFWMQEVEWRG